MDTVFDTLDHLIGFNTVSSNSNLDLISYLEAFCTNLGAETQRIYGKTQEKCGLIAHFWSSCGGRHHSLWTHGCCPNRGTKLDATRLSTNTRGRSVLRPRDNRHEGLFGLYAFGCAKVYTT